LSSDLRYEYLISWPYRVWQDLVPQSSVTEVSICTTVQSHDRAS